MTSCYISTAPFLTNLISNYRMTLESRSEFTQDHQNWYCSILSCLKSAPFLRYLRLKSTVTLNLG